MHFTTINLIAYMRHHQETLDSDDRVVKSLLHPLLRQSGRLFVTIGQRMMQAGSQTTKNYSSLENEVCI